jgi:hypothetical protein
MAFGTFKSEKAFAAAYVLECGAAVGTFPVEVLQ